MYLLHNNVWKYVSSNLIQKNPNKSIKSSNAYCSYALTAYT